MNKSSLLLIVLGLASSAFAADTWTIDSRHSSVGFSVRNFFVPVEGSFKIKEGKIVVDPANSANNSVEAVITVGSVNTQDADRDQHLNTKDFFLTEQFPSAAFKSLKWHNAGDNKYTVHGELTIKDVTKPLSLEVSYLGQGPGNRGKTVSGWQAKGKMNRKDWGIDYGKSIADEVELTINVQGVKEEAAPAAPAKQG